MTWPTIVLATLLAGALLRFFWIGSHESVSVAHAVVTAALIVGVTVSVRHDTAIRPPAVVARAATPPTTADVAESVPVSVQGTTETREQADRLAACESAIAAISTAVGQAASAGIPVDPALLGASTSDTSTDPARRLQSCEVRLRAIAATLPAATPGP